MNLKSVRKGLRELVGSDPNDAASCTLCGAHRREVARILEGRDGYVCEGCVFAAAGFLAGKDVPENIAGNTFHVIGLVLSWVDERTPHAAVESLFDAASALAGATPERCRIVATHAFRLEDYPRAGSALLRIAPTERTTEDALGALAAHVTVGDRPAIARGLDELAGKSLGELHRIQADLHRAWAAFRIEERAAPTFTFDGDALGPMIARLRDLNAPPSLGQALEVAAAYERTRDTAAALRRVDEALAVASKASRHILRGDILLERDPAAAREAWQSALASTHPDSVWAARARARLERRAG